MPICRTCKKNFHYCTSCDFDEVMSCGYCCEECLKTGEKEDIDNIVEFFGRLSENDRKFVYNLVEEIPEVIIQLAMEQFDNSELNQEKLSLTEQNIDFLLQGFKNP